MKKVVLSFLKQNGYQIKYEERVGGRIFIAFKKTTNKVEEIDEFLKHVANFYYIESFYLVPSSTFIHNKLFSYDTYAEALRLLFNEKPTTIVFKFLTYKSPSAFEAKKRFISGLLQ